VEEIRAAGGEIYAITSEPQRLASQAEEVWQLAFESVGDPHHEISNTCRERGLLELFVNTRTNLMEFDENSPYSHPKGYFQPGVLSLAADGRVLYRWRGTPTRKNMGGATERPTAKHVFDNVSRALSVSASSDEPVDAELDRKPKLDSRGIPWPLFVSLLVANGWFIKPRTFGFMSNGPSVERRAKRAVLRIPFFLAAWGIAFAQLPIAWVGLALLGWAAWLTPHIRFINKQFQTEPVEP
jgi:hypothetical protein